MLDELMKAYGDVYNSILSAASELTGKTEPPDFVNVPYVGMGVFDWTRAVSSRAVADASADALGLAQRTRKTVVTFQIVAITRNVKPEYATRWFGDVDETEHNDESGVTDND